MLAVLSCGAVQALPVANPAAASLLCDGIFWEGHCGDMCDPCLTWCDAFSMRVGFWGNYEFNRYMETNDTNEHRDVDVTKVIHNAGYVVGNFWDRFDIYGTLGASKIDLWGDMAVWDSQSNTAAVTASGQALFHLQTDTDFAWSIGARGTVWECGCTSIGAEFQYLQTRPQLKFFDEYNNDAAVTERMRQAFATGGYGIKYYDWQIGLGIAHRINMLVPYAAVRWSNAKLDLGKAILNDGTGGIANHTRLDTLRSIKSWGYAVGVSLVDCEKMALTVEGGFAASLEASVIGEIRF